MYIDDLNKLLPDRELGRVIGGVYICPRETISHGRVNNHVYYMTLHIFQTHMIFTHEYTNDVISDTTMSLIKYTKYVTAPSKNRR
jgi:hypothetical protein